MKFRILLFILLISTINLSAQNFNTQISQINRRMQTDREMMTMRENRTVSNIDELEKVEIKRQILKNEAADLEQQLKVGENQKQTQKLQKKLDKVNKKIAEVDKKVASLNAEIEIDKKKLEEEKAKKRK